MYVRLVGWCDWHLVGKGLGGTAKQSTKQEEPHTAKNCLAQNLTNYLVHSVEVDKPWFMDRILIDSVAKVLKQNFGIVYLHFHNSTHLFLAPIIFLHLNFVFDPWS